MRTIPILVSPGGDAVVRARGSPGPCGCDAGRLVQRPPGFVPSNTPAAAADPPAATTPHNAAQRQ